MEEMMININLNLIIDLYQEIMMTEEMKEMDRITKIQKEVQLIMVT